MLMLSSVFFPWLFLAADPERLDRLAQLSIEELISLQVVSAEKRKQPFPKSPAAVYVVSREDIERSGATQLVELLRFVPGVQVARISTNVWAVSIRGFNELHADKLLVLIDGRPIYNHLFAGVFWPMFEMSSDEIERIEVIRGPGSTLWGANAVNGIINIITRSSADTQGLYVGVGSGNVERAIGDVRYGFQIGPDTTARVNYGFTERENEDVPFGPRLVADERIQDGRVGLRVDHRFFNDATLLVKGDYFKNFGRRTPAPPELSINDHGWHIQARLQHTNLEGVTRSANVFADSVTRQNELSWHVYDLDLQEQRRLGRHQLVYGVGFRQIDDLVTQGLAGGFEFHPQRNNEKVGNLFFQDRLTLSEHLSLTMGFKLEVNDFTDAEFQPNLRLHYTPAKDSSLNLWAAASRAVHVPSRIERDSITLDRPGSRLPRVRGNPELDASYVTAYETGFRSRLGKAWWIDSALFFNDYANQPAFEATEMPNDYLRVNGVEGETYGIDGSLEVRPFPWWRLTASFTVLEADFELLAGPRERLDLTDFLENQSPTRQWNLRSQMNVVEGLTLNLHWRYMGAVSQTSLASPAVPPPEVIPAYDNLDVQVSWHITPSIRAELIGRDLLGEHAEIFLYEHEPQIHMELKFWF